MLVLAPILILALTAITLGLLARFRPGFLYYWPVAVVGAFVAWVSVWVARFQIPVVTKANLWLDITGSPFFLLDEISWQFVLALVVLALATLLTDAIRISETRWDLWAGMLAVAALGSFSAMSGNLLTFILTWSLIDIMEFLVLIVSASDRDMRLRSVNFFSLSVLGTMFAVWAELSAVSQGASLSFDRVPPASAFYLVIAIGLRLGVLPLQLTFFSSGQQQRGLGAIFRLTPPLTSLVLAVRLAQAGVVLEAEIWFVALFGLAAIYGAVAWSRARSALRGRTYWILAVASLALVAVVRGQPAAALSWSLFLVYAGGFLFLFSSRQPRYWPLIALAMAAISTLPFTPGWAGLGIYAAPFRPFLILYLVAQAFLIAGYFRHARRWTEPITGVERWVGLVYPGGLLLILGVYYLVGWGLFPSSMAVTSQVWPAIAVIVLAAALAFGASRGFRPSADFIQVLDSIFSLRWFYRVLDRLFAGLAVALRLLNAMLEGPGGVLWTLLILVLLVSIITQIGAGV